MSNENGITVTDVFGMAKSCQKLLDTIAMGVGKFYEPWHTVRMAKAEAKEISIISEAITENLFLPIRYDDEKIHINAEDANQLATRAQNRALYQEMKKQQNIESVISKAYNQLKNTEDVSEEPVDLDWINEFFDNVANVSNDDMQFFWGKLLAGEVLKPKSFSLRTLATLKNLTNYEAELFTKIAPYILGNKPYPDNDYISYFLLSNPDLLNRNNIPFGCIIRLSDAGLINLAGNAMVGFNMEPEQSTRLIGHNKSILIKNGTNQKVTLNYSAYPLTEAGAELLPIACDTKYTDNNNYLLDCLDYLRLHGLGTFYNEPWPQEISASIE